MDAWVANRLDDTPFLRTRSIRFEYPCSPELFKCPSSATWRRLVNGEAYPSSESILVHMNDPVIRLPAASCDMAKEGIFSVLSIIWIRMQQISPEALATTQLEDPNAITDVCPTILASCQGGRALSHALSTMYTSNTHLLGSKNPNSIAFWNLLNLRLFARVDVLELAAGRQGANRAHMALKQTAAWCQTRYARRACLHAGEIIASMSRCRLKDGTMVHSEAAMFSAALVLGLYVFMMGPDGHGSEGGHTGTPAEEPYEFLDPVDWSKIDDVAVGDDSFEVSGVVTNSSESAAARFVRHGGAVSFSGVVCESGYNASKMILLEFASLLEEVGKWKSKGSVHILRIMSDSLLDVDFANP